VLERGWGFRYEGRKTIVYERIDLIRPENWSLLLEDLQQRHRPDDQPVEIGRLNFLRDTAEITLYYDAQASGAARVVPVGNRHMPEDHESLDD
jgi:hypothetical protein